MPFFSRVFRSKDSGTRTPKFKNKVPQSNGVVSAPPPKPHWDDAWTRKEVEPEEIQELLRGCTLELKSRALDMPFLLLPFRPASDPSAARTFIRNYFSMDKGAQMVGERLEQELMLTEPMVLSSVMKWCWSRLAGGVVTWEAYELFRVGEHDSDMARDAFATFIPLSVESDARTKIVFDFFDLMAAIAAHGKTNGMGGRKLSRLAGWWAFEQVNAGNGFDAGYKSWSSAADATSHLFFAYLRSLSPDSVRGINGVSALPISLQTLVQETRYPPETAPYESTSKVVMVVDSVSPTPFALLRRAKHFEYRDDDQTLQQFSDFEDPVQALTDECRRVLKSISSANQSAISTTKASTSLGDSSWSRFEDMGFAGLGDYDDDEEPDSALGKKREAPQGLRSAPQTKSNDLGRPTTPSWADFLSSGFVDEANDSGPAPLLLPPDKILPPIKLDFDKRGQSSQSHKRVPDRNLEPGELASINALDLDDAFWWVWITSLAGEETAARKSAFGRCALIETSISGGTWLVIEEMVKGAASEPEVGAYIAEKKGRFTFGKRNKMSRTKSMGRKNPAPKVEPFPRSSQPSPMSKTSIGPDQHARIQAAAAALQQKHREQDSTEDPVQISPRRARQGDAVSTKTNSVFTLQPVIMSEAAPAMKWANTYDKKAIRAAYLGNNFAGKGSATDLGAGMDTNGSITPMPPSITPQPPKEAAKHDYGFPNQEAGDAERNLPMLPIETPNETPRAPMGPPPPVPAAPLPVEPVTQPLNHVAAVAADVPLPNATPMEPTERTFSESEQLEPTRTITQEQPEGVSPVSSPESKKDRKKLKKQQGGGLKGLFGKKKGPATPAPAHPADSTAVAAARAAYQGPQTRVNYNASNSLTRRFSGIGRKKNLPASPPINAPGSGNDALPAPAPPFKDQYDSQASLSRIDSNEERRADNEFETFDQGPQTFNQGHPLNPSNQTFNQGPLDQPAYVPVSPDRPSFVPESPTVSRPSTTEHQGPHYEPPIGRGEYEPSLSSGAETPAEPIQDRWAQIRKNAAERAERQTEQRMSEDKGADDEAEDDGDQETIESRVARIKARVAELTGNMGNEPKAAAT